jgi:hypothetical protein
MREADHKISRIGHFAFLENICGMHKEEIGVEVDTKPRPMMCREAKG